jgi:hypothetical protein
MQLKNNVAAYFEPLFTRSVVENNFDKLSENVLMQQ